MVLDIKRLKKGNTLNSHPKQKTKTRREYSANERSFWKMKIISAPSSALDATGAWDKWICDLSRADFYICVISGKGQQCSLTYGRLEKQQKRHRFPQNNDINMWQVLDDSVSRLRVVSKMKFNANNQKNRYKEFRDWISSACWGTKLYDVLLRITKETGSDQVPSWNPTDKHLCTRLSDDIIRANITRDSRRKKHQALINLLRHLDKNT